MIGVIALVVIVVLVFLGWTKDIPFTSPYEVNAVFQSANSIRPGSPVRIAGVDVGKVKEVKADEDTDAAVVVLQIDDDGLPLHEDATAKIRPRIFLEGNFFVDLQARLAVGAGARGRRDDHGHADRHPGAARPGADLAAVRHAAGPQGRARRRSPWRSPPSRRRPRTARPTRSTRGETAAESFNDAYDDIPEAERSTAIVLDALLGTEPGRDLSRLIDGTARTTGALIRNENALRGLITNFNVTMAAFASESGNLQPLGRASCRSRSRAPTARSRRSTRRSRPRARSRARSCPASARRRPRSMRRCRGSHRRGR